MILVDAHGRPFAKPEPPALDAPIEAKIAWLRADAAYRDAVAACAGKAFAGAFNRSLRRRK